MQMLVPLWLPIIVSAVAVFVASSLAWMVLPHHKKDIKTLPNEKALTDHLKQLGLDPGTYMWPGCGDGDMKSPEFQARYKEGPWGSINVLAKQPNFMANLLGVFIVYLVISIFVGYITLRAEDLGAGFMPVFRVAGATAILGYCAGPFPGGIFLGKPLRFMFTDFLDNVVYGLLTGLIFGWLWPPAAGA
ncbi:MAG: hypothetical protein PVI86_15845 [Phycisphaerae bacterium]|jgi:hypothetical protein